jgi:hypothetical protein
MKIIIHPGYGKTATTTLQNQLFGNHSQILSLGRPWTKNSLAFVKELKKHQGLDFDDKNISFSLNKLINVDKKNKTVAVLSDENIHRNAEMVGWFAERIKNLFPDAEILLTIRNQIQILESVYSDSGQILKNQPKPFDGRYIALLPWLEWSWKNWDNSFFGLIDYHKHIEMYQAIFGEKKVHILLYEDLLNTPDKFIERLCSILTIDYDESMSLLLNKWDNPPITRRKENYLKLRQYLFPTLERDKIPFANNFMKLIDKYVGSGSAPSSKQKIPEKWVDKLNDRYRLGNKILVDKYGLPLDKYNYPL